MKLAIYLAALVLGWRALYVLEEPTAIAPLGIFTAAGLVAWGVCGLIEERS